MRVTRVPALGHSRHAPGLVALLRIEVDVEMVGLHHFELEVFVLNLVASEVVLPLGAGGHQEEGQHGREQGQGMPEYLAHKRTPGVVGLRVTDSGPPTAKVAPTLRGPFFGRIRTGYGKLVAGLSPARYADGEHPGAVSASSDDRPPRGCRSGGRTCQIRESSYPAPRAPVRCQARRWCFEDQGSG